MEHNVSVISLRSGKTYASPSSSEPENKAEEKYEEVLVEEKYLKGTKKEE